MPDDTNIPTTPQAGTPGGTPTPGGSTIPPEPQAGDGQETFSLEEARKLRRENQTLRQRQKTIDEAEAAAAAAKLSETDRLQKQYTDLQAQHDAYKAAMQKRIVRYEVMQQAAKLKIVDPDAAAMLLDPSGFELDDDGVPKNAEKLLKDLIKNKPYLDGAAAGTQNGGQGGTPAQSAPSIPAMNPPGRSSITSPVGAQGGAIPRLSDLYKRP